MTDKIIEGFADIEETEDGKIKIHFAPGCFDNFDGTQEELDELIKEIEDAFTNGDALTNAISLDDLEEDEIKEILDMLPDDDAPRTLQ